MYSKGIQMMNFLVGASIIVLASFSIILIIVFFNDAKNQNIEWGEFRVVAGMLVTVALYPLLDKLTFLNSSIVFVKDMVLVIAGFVSLSGILDILKSKKGAPNEVDIT